MITQAKEATATRSEDSLAVRFARDGFVHLRQCLAPSEVTTVRSRLIELFDQPSAYAGDISGSPYIDHVYFDAFNRYPDLAWIPFLPPVVDALRTLLGEDFVYIPEFAIHDSGYGSWHKDTTSQETAGHHFHWDSDFKMVQVGLYLQDNDREYAGGLDVVRGSHQRRDRVAEHSRPTRLDRAVRGLVYRLTNARNEVIKESLRSGAGDVVIFNLRLDHKATAPRRRPVPRTHRKLAAFSVASANNAHARRYFDFIRSRPDYVYLENYAYHAELRQRASAAGVSLFEP